MFWPTNSSNVNTLGAITIFKNMRIIAKRALREYWEEYPETEQHLKTWYQIVKQANWDTPNDVKAVFGNASIVGNGRIVFNVKGNDYRLIVKISYEKSLVFIRFLGTHSEYDKIDASEI